MNEITHSGKLEPRRSLEQDDWKHHAAMVDQITRELEQAAHSVMVRFDGDLPEEPDGAAEVRKLRDNQRQALVALAEGRNHGESAIAAGVDARTLHRWMKQDPDFARALANIRERAVQGAWDRLSHGAQSAAGALVEASERGDVRAAVALLKLVGPSPRESEAPLKIGSSRASGTQREVQMRLRELLVSLVTETSEPVESALADEKCPMPAAKSEIGHGA